VLASGRRETRRLWRCTRDPSARWRERRRLGMTPSNIALAHVVSGMARSRVVVYRAVRRTGALVLHRAACQAADIIRGRKSLR
jgi:hypothetical protein